MPFTPIEKIQKPRILLLDFDTTLENSLREQGYNIFSGQSGFSGSPHSIKVHKSELEIIFWNCSNIKIPETIHSFAPVGIYKIPKDPVRSALSSLEEYISRVRNKRGITVLFLGMNHIDHQVLAEATGRSFSLYSRLTTTLFPIQSDHILTPFLQRFILEQNIRFCIGWIDNLVGYKEFFNDEDHNHFVGYSGDLLILPHIEDKKAAILVLLQDVLPHLCSSEIFPDLAMFSWLKEDAFITPPVKDKIKEKEKITLELEQRLIKIDKAIKKEQEDNSYLTQALVADDSELFTPMKRLKPQIIKMLQDDLGFTVGDIDIKQKELGKSLTEDIQIKDGSFFALGEIKGTDSGAKSNWVKKDLLANMGIFLKLNDLKPSEVSTMLIFNHERRKDPKERSKPFKDDPDLIKYCEKENITLVPVYELYKLCLSVKYGRLGKNTARELLKKPGLFIHS